jgi:hypothetical protein
MAHKIFHSFFTLQKTSEKFWYLVVGIWGKKPTTNYQIFGGKTDRKFLPGWRNW